MSSRATTQAPTHQHRYRKRLGTRMARPGTWWRSAAGAGNVLSGNAVNGVRIGEFQASTIR
jgi:hypothetical protein